MMATKTDNGLRRMRTALSKLGCVLMLVIRTSIVDIVRVGIPSLLVWVFIYYLVFGGNRLAMTSKDVVSALQAVTWPSMITFLVFLFRKQLTRILNEVPHFVGRSYYRHGSAVLEANNKSEKLDTHGKPTDSQCERAEIDKAVGALVREFGGTCYFERCIGNQSCRFDVVIETDNKIYGVEIKKNLASDTDWERIFNRVWALYLTYDEALRCRFVFIAMVVGSVKKDDELRLLRLGQRQKFDARVKILR